MRMRLAEKGRIVPPPMLDAPFQKLSEVVRSWPGIVSATHWHFSRSGQVDGADFYRGDDELGHIHLDGEVHLAPSPAITRALIAAGAAERFPWADNGEWATYRIRSEAGLRHAERLFRLGYDYLGGASETGLVKAAAKIGEAS